ncbi:MAG: FAD-dependent oxidoreductase [Candidatus Omnitrophota bacterium]
MKRIVIIGNSAAGIAASEAIRESDKESSVTIVSDEPFVAYERHKILGLLEGKIKERDLFYRDQDFYKNNALDLLLGREVVELNLNKKKVIFKDREFVGFDELLIASGARVSLPKLPGIQKDGIVALNGLSELKYIVDNLPIAHTVIIIGPGQVAEELARIIAAKKIDVKYLGALSGPIEGVDEICDNPILEILGDSEARAVRLSTQKVVGASLVIFPVTGHANIDLVKDTQIKVNKGIVVDEAMRTNVPYVLAAGDVCEYQDENRHKVRGWESSQSEGKIAGRTLRGVQCLT